MKLSAAFLLFCLIFQAWAQSATRPPAVDARPNVTNPLIWSPEPVGPQPLPNMPPIQLLEPIAEYPFRALSGTERCLLVATRGSTIIAIELTALRLGPRVVGWSPKIVDDATLTSKWKYEAPKLDEQIAASNPVTAAIAATSSLPKGNIVSNLEQNQTAVSSSAKTWSSREKDAQGSEVMRGETAQTVTINGKRYSKYTNFRYASTEVRTPDSDEYFCEP